MRNNRQKYIVLLYEQYSYEILKQSYKKGCIYNNGSFKITTRLKVRASIQANKKGNIAKVGQDNKSQSTLDFNLSVKTR